AGARVGQAGRPEAGGGSGRRAEQSGRRRRPVEGLRQPRDHVIRSPAMAHLTVAASESAFKRSFEVLRDSIVWEKQDSANFGPFTAGYHVKGHLEGGDVDLRADNTIQIKELDVRWDKLAFSLGLDI